MAKPPMKGKIRLFVLIIDPNWKVGRYQRLELRSAHELLTWQERVRDDDLRQNRDLGTETKIYTYYELEDGTREMVKCDYAIADVGQPVRKLFCSSCETGFEYFLDRPEQMIQGVVTTCQACQAKQFHDGDDDGDIEAHYERLTRREEY